MSKKKELVFSVTRKDLEIQTFQSGGKGGQHQNKTSSGVRIIHRPSGAVGESRTDRSQHRNKRIALKRLSENQKFKIWVQRKVFEITDGKTLEQKVELQMQPENLKIEQLSEDGKWEKFDECN